MKGVVFNILEEVVVDAHGEDIWDEFLEKAGVNGAYTSLGNYSDDELTTLVETAASATDMTAGEFLRWFGERALPRLRDRYPVLFEDCRSGRSLILSVNSFIHPEVRKLYAGASCPFFHLNETPRGVIMGYQSSRRMCDLAHGFVNGVAHLFDERIDVEHRKCMNKGDERCLMELSWLS